MQMAVATASRVLHQVVRGRVCEVLEPADVVEALHLFHSVVAIAGPFVHLVGQQKSQYDVF